MIPGDRYAPGQQGELAKNVDRILRRWRRFQSDDPRELSRIARER